MKARNILIFILFICSHTLFAQFGIRAGINSANQIQSLNHQAISNGFSTNNLTGYQIGVIYQAMPKKSGLGFEVGALISQKGSSIDSTGIAFSDKELNYLEVPFNLRYRLSLGFLGIYGVAGVYGGYELSGQTTNYISKTTQQDMLAGFMDHVDYGYNLGCGLEFLKKIQLGLNWSQGLKNNTAANLQTSTNPTNRVYTVNLVYLF